MTLPDWHWNEMQQVGTDYNDLNEVEIYDKRMAEFRDVVAENRRILDTLKLQEGSALLEIGCGTGRLVRAAAQAGYRAFAVDVSQMMMTYAAKRAKEEGVGDIVFKYAGFLTMDFPDETFDAVVSNAALHHLPDAWKLVALRNIARVLKPKGQLLLGDVVFTLEEEQAPESLFEQFASAVPPGMRKEAARHIAKEFSTYDWIIEGLLVRAGFEIVSSDATPSMAFSVYRCLKM